MRGKITPECQRFRVGQEFIVDSTAALRISCNWAFADIQRDLVHILYGGYYPWMKEKGVASRAARTGSGRWCSGSKGSRTNKEVVRLDYHSTLARGGGFRDN